jgi:hypothetical protein
MKNFTKIAAAVSLALAAGSASAAVTLPSAGNGLSQLLFSLEDNNTASADYKHTFAVDLSLGHTGLNYLSFLNGTQGANGTLTWDLNTVSAFSGFASDTASLRWSVVGGNQRTNANAATDWGALATANSAADFPVVNGTNVVRTALTGTGSIGGWYANINANIGANQAVDINPFTATTSLYETKLGDLGGLQDSVGLHTVGAGSDNFFRATLATTAAGDPIQYSQLGSFSLSSGNILTYTAGGAPSPVPVPAAVWLFGSALAGFLGISRRNKQAAGFAA